MKHRNLFLQLGSWILILFLTSCMTNKDLDYQTGVTPGTKGEVYFDSSNPTDVVLTPTEYAIDPAVTLILNRAGDVSQALSVPIEVDVCESMTIPSTVSFAAGSSLATLRIDLSGLPTLKYYNYTVHVASDYANPYSTVGSNIASGKVIISDWVKVVNQAKTFFTNSLPSEDDVRAGTGVYCYSDIYKLMGTNLFKIDKMYGYSDCNMEFSVQKGYDPSSDPDFDSSDSRTWRGIFDPNTNLWVDSWTGWHYWWVITDANNYAYVQPEGITQKCRIAIYPTQSDYDYSIVRFSKTGDSMGFIRLATYILSDDYSVMMWKYTYYCWTPDMLTE